MRAMVGWRGVGSVVAAVMVLVALTSCRPNFVDGSTMQATIEGDGVRLSWSPGRADEGRTLTSYRIDVDGTEITRIDPSETSCLLTGLTAETDHDVEITVYDSNGEWSGESEYVKSVTATFTTPAGSDDSGGIRCEVVDPPTPAAVTVVLSQPTPGADTLVIGGQVAPITYQLAVANTGETASADVTVTNPVPTGTTLVTDSPSCGTATACTVEVVDGVIGWTLAGLPAESSTDLTFSVTVNPELATTTSIESTATYTTTGQDCEANPCTTNTINNPAEPWRWTGSFRNGKKVTIDSINTVFYSGRNTFNALTMPTNDPAAVITVTWECYPNLNCLMENDIHSRTMTFNFVWDIDDYRNWAMYATVTATQGTRTMTDVTFMQFDIEKGSIFTTS